MLSKSLQEKWDKQHTKAFGINVILFLYTEIKVLDACVANPVLLWWMGGFGCLIWSSDV